MSKQNVQCQLLPTKIYAKNYCPQMKLNEIRISHSQQSTIIPLVHLAEGSGPINGSHTLVRKGERVHLTRCALSIAGVEANDIAGLRPGVDGDREFGFGDEPVDALGARRGSKGAGVAVAIVSVCFRNSQKSFSVKLLGVASLTS